MATNGARITINKSTLNRLEPPSREEGRRILWDASLKGFGVRLNPAGSIVFIVQYRMGSRATTSTRTFTIGKYGSPWSPDAAREEARSLLEQVRRGIDPAAERETRRRAERAVEEASAAASVAAERYDFDAFVDRYVERHVKANGLRSLADIEGTLDRDVRPRFRGRSALSITRQDCIELRAAVGLRSQAAANKAHKWMSALFAWGVEHDGLPTSPMFGLKRPFREPKRTRVLADWEIAVIWSVLPAMIWQFGMLMRLLILTGQRLREVAGIRWEEVDLEKREWIIPGARTKNKRDHLVSISPQVGRLLASIEPDPGRRRGLMLTTNGRTPISGFSRSKARLDTLVVDALKGKRWRGRQPLEPWVRHDARRTVSTGFGELRIPIEVAEAVLNHVSGSMSGVAGTYWLYKFAPEKRRAMEKWAAKVERVITAHGVGFGEL